MIIEDDKEEIVNGFVEKKKKNKLDCLFVWKNNDVFLFVFDKIRVYDDEEGGGGEDNSDVDEFLMKKRFREQVVVDEFLMKKKVKVDVEEVEGK